MQPIVSASPQEQGAGILLSYVPNLSLIRSLTNQKLGNLSGFCFLVLLVASAFFASSSLASAANRLGEFLPQAQVETVFPGADRIGDPAGSPPLAPVYRGDELTGYVFLNSDFADSTGYSGKPMHIVAGVDLQGRITGIQLIAHQEPIVLIGISERRIIDAVVSLIGTNVVEVAAGRQPIPRVDIVSGATVTVLVMGDSVLRAAIRVVREGRLSGLDPGAPAAAAPQLRTIDMEQSEIRSWEELVGDGSVRRLNLGIGDVNEEFARASTPQAAARPEAGDPDETFIDLYVALATIPTVGRSLLGDAAYEQMLRQLQPGAHAILVAGRGRYSFKGSGYVRGGIFDRIELVQDVDTLRFRDRQHTRIGDIAADGAPRFPEISLFVIPPDFGFEPTDPWSLQLLVQRSIGALESAFLPFEVSYRPPDHYVATQTPEVAVPQPAPSPAPGVQTAEALGGDLGDPVWVRMWRANTVNIAIAGIAILVLTVIFFFQDALVKRYRLYLWVRRSFLVFTLVWIGWIANAQLSVVNVLTFINSLMTEFSWTFFLAAPLIFIFWLSVAAGLLFWGRGPFCGWLCPFGALQELTNNIAQALRVPQLKIPWGLNERLWPIKYIIFLGLFGLSLYSMQAASIAAEVEPFKTAITLKFLREWPFVIYAVALLGAGLFVERFFCRYLCPLGAALAIPSRISMFFGWLKRHPECGSPCHRCAKECPVQCIHPDGHINPNECIWCMHCQDLFWDDHRCPSMIQRRIKREKREALTSPSMRGGAKKTPLVTDAEANRSRLDAKHF
jgi:NosR/NirI family transcriptional regulator, nitrous oxide reductase regulator